MVEETLSKEELERLTKMEGEVRGVVFKTDAEYILRKKGKTGLAKVEGELQRLGYPIKYGSIRSMDFYPIGTRILSLRVARKVLGFSDEEIQEMGASAPKHSLIIKLFMKYFLSISQTFRQVPKMWDKHYTVGKLVPFEINEKEKYLILRLTDLNLDPLFCLYLTGYFSAITAMIVKSPVTSEETHCFFRGQEFHQYLVKWQ